jgi:hypothetical protein
LKLLYPIARRASPRCAARAASAEAAFLRVNADAPRRQGATGHTTARSWRLRRDRPGAGQQPIRAFFSELFAAFPDFPITAGPDRGRQTSAAVPWHAPGTFTGGPFQAILPTGRRAEIGGADIKEIAGG